MNKKRQISYFYKEYELEDFKEWKKRRNHIRIKANILKCIYKMLLGKKIFFIYKK
jgi:hypothetical protein